MGSLGRLLTRRSIRRLADAGSLERGAQYAERGRVRDVRLDGDLLVAEVVGTRAYRVRLWPEGTDLAHVCTCPMGEQGVFCKHCVAAGLDWIMRGADTPAREPTLTELRAHLLRQRKEALVELLMEQAGADERLRRRLRLEAIRPRRHAK